MPSAQATQATPLAEEAARHATALLIIDMIGEWQAPGMASLLEAAHAMAPALARLKKRCKEAGVPAVYVNDNLGRWRSDFQSLVAAAREAGGKASEMAGLLMPGKEDYFVLKPKHSAFFATPLDLLLEHLKVHKLILAGVSADQCVMATAMDALMHDYEVVVVTDCIASPSPQRTDAACRHFAEVLKTSTSAADELELPFTPP